jgi:hypothetical protein
VRRTPAEYQSRYCMLNTVKLRYETADMGEVLIVYDFEQRKFKHRLSTGCRNPLTAALSTSSTETFQNA